ncbi:MAG: tryptophan--tRNA ligase [Oscillospiraceae bacterium]|jgi:tryptophanyl-tRNA synthetase|nr:tryptophan--tRNA ligase [Oscillospiraceae bacterium]
MKMQMMENKKRILSAIQPSGLPTLGNYLGALKNWAGMAREFDCFFAVADLHAITVRQDPALLKKQTLQMYALLLAIGLDPQRDTLFIQSHVPEHSQLAWILNCYAQFGEMSRMTQFKDKSSVYTDNINVGLFAYPALMAADILLYQADFVPVGADQKQHLEITRDIAARFNGIYGDVFKVPEPYIGKQGARIMSLQDPSRKMSKSDENLKSFISILDKPDSIMKKFKSAVTDSQAQVKYSPGKDGINNLMNIYSCCRGKDYEEIEKEFEGRGYGDFKVAVAQAVIEELQPVSERFERLIDDKAYLEQCARQGAQKAQMTASRTLEQVMKKVGFYKI